MIAGLLLAAGRGSRFGGDKLLALLGERAVLHWSADALTGVADETLVVVPPDSTPLRAALAPLVVRIVENSARDDGMSSSIVAGIAALPDDVEAVIVALGDQPLVSRNVIASLRDTWRATRAPAVIPRYRDGRGHPVLFDRRCFGALLALRGDRGARAVLDTLGDAVVEVHIEADMPLDVDTPEALDAVRRLLG